MEIKQKIPGALCFINFTDSHNAFCARTKKVEDGTMKLTSFTEFSWTESSELADKPDGETTSEVVVAECETDGYIQYASIVSAHKHGDYVTMNCHGNHAYTFKIGRKAPVYDVDG